MWTTHAHKESKQKPRESTEAREQQSRNGAIDIPTLTYQKKQTFTAKQKTWNLLRQNLQQSIDCYQPCYGPSKLSGHAQATSTRTEPNRSTAENSAELRREPNLPSRVCRERMQKCLSSEICNMSNVFGDMTFRELQYVCTYHEARSALIFHTTQKMARPAGGQNCVKT